MFETQKNTPDIQTILESSVIKHASNPLSIDVPRFLFIRQTERRSFLSLASAGPQREKKLDQMKMKFQRSQDFQGERRKN